MNQLRRIAVWVHETQTATFRWVLTEGLDGRVRDVRSSEHEFVSFEGALNEGADALKSMCADIKTGPRVELADTARKAGAPSLGLVRSLRNAIKEIC